LMAERILVVPSVLLLIFLIMVLSLLLEFFVGR
jgi:hypothetical protein